MAPKLIKTDFPFTFISMEADLDYLLARMIHFLGAGFHARAGYFAHQACEKYLKALSVERVALTWKPRPAPTGSRSEPYVRFLGDAKAKADLDA